MSAGTDYERLRRLAEDLGGGGWAVSPEATELARGVLALLGERDEDAKAYDALMMASTDALAAKERELVAVREERDAALRDRDEWYRLRGIYELQRDAAERERDTLRACIEMLRENLRHEAGKLPQAELRRVLEDLAALARAALSVVDTRPEDLGE